MLKPVVPMITSLMDAAEVRVRLVAALLAESTWSPFTATNSVRRRLKYQGEDQIAMSAVTSQSQVDITSGFPGGGYVGQQHQRRLPRVQGSHRSPAGRPCPWAASIVLYLEDDYQVPSSIPASSVYFVADDTGPKTNRRWSPGLRRRCAEARHRRVLRCYQV